ncbi:MAG TPA: hypothetical protein VH092_39025 [Urbifossiella sp.]|nr:hypothetical protein [Urbifossiella sp.]
MYRTPPPHRHLGCERHAVGIWRRRGADAFDTLVRIACLEGVSALEAAVEEVLSDAPPRSGCPGTFAPDQVALPRRVRHRGNFRSAAGLREKILAYIA